MKDDPDLRHKAEEALKKRQSKSDSIRSDVEIRRMVHELEVHQIELELQNEELQLAKNEAELATAKYVELYEFAPSGYLILSGKGKIIQLNLAGAQMLGKPRSQLKNSLFSFLVTDESKPAFKLFLSSVFNSNAKETCEVSLSIPNSQPLQVSITGLAEPDKDECFVTLVDITERKRNEKEILLAYEELTFQNEENTKRVNELTIAKAELAFQNEEKAKRAAELILANKELLFQNDEKTKRANELMDANKLIAFQRDRMNEISGLVPGVVYQYRLRPDGTSCFPYASEAIRQIYRVTPEEVREDATKVFSNLHPDDFDGVVASIQASAKELCPWQHEYRVKFDDGTIRTLYGNALPQPEEDGSVLWTGFITDITEQKQVEVALKQSELSFRNVLELSPIPNIVHRNFVVIYANLALLKMIGVDELEDVLGANILDWIPPDFRETVKQRNSQVSEENIAISMAEIQFFRSDGTMVEAEVQSTPIVFNGLPAIHSALKDISEQKRLMNLMKENNSRLALATQMAKMAWWEMDVVTGAISYDQRKVEMLGYTSGNFDHYKGFTDLIHPDDHEKTMNAMRGHLSGLFERYEVEYRIRTHSGEYLWFYDCGTAVKWDDKGKPLYISGYVLDISDRKRTEAKLYDSERFFNSVFNSQTSQIAILDETGKVIQVNQKWRELANAYAILPDLVCEGANYLLVCDATTGPDAVYAKATAAGIRSVIDKSKTTFSSEYPCNTPIEELWYSSTVTPMDGDGFIRILVVIDDITDRKFAQESLFDSEARYSAMISSISDVIAIIGADGMMKYISSNITKFFGWLPLDQESISTFALIHPDDFVEVEKKIFTLLEHGDSNLNTEFRVRCKDGSYKPIELNVSNLLNDPLINGLLLNFHDITDRKLAAELLQKSEARYSAMISNISDVIGIMDANGLMTYKSANIEKFFGWSPEERIGTSGFATIHPDDIAYVQNIFSSLLDEDNSVNTLEFRYQCKDGTYKPIELTASNQLNNPAINGVLLNYRDISERKATEADLEEISEKYRGLSEASFESIFISEKGVCIEQNLAAELMFGYSTEEALTRYGTDWIVPEDREMVMNNIISGHQEPYEAMALRKDGSTFPCVLHGRMMQYKGKDVRVTSLSDISSLKKAEYALIIAKENAEANEQKFVSIIQSQSEGIGFVNQNEVFEFANTASERIFETGKDELVGTCLYDYLIPGEREKVDQQTHNRLEGDVNTYELQITTKKGNAKYIDITATPKLDGNNNYQGAYGVFRDITDRKKAEDEVQRVSTRLALATHAGNVGIWDYDIVNNTMLWDDQMYALYGIKKNDFGGVYETWRAGLHPDDAERGDLEVQMAISGEKEFYTEFRVIWPDKSVHSIKAIASIKRDETGMALNMIGTNWDITDQKQAQEALLKARNEADAANKAKSLFLANMSHEIRTPLNAIIGFSQLLNREQLTDRQNEYSVSIHRSGEHLLKLLNDILELSKIEAGYGNINMVNIDLYALLADIRMMFSQQAQSKQLQLTFETAGNLPQYILIDDNKLRQILINLIGNALKFTSKGGISVRALIDQSDEMKTILVIEVQDSGTGISEHEIGNLFRQFEQASEGIKQSNGTGLGLALSREQAILMGGNITVESKEGEGSVFTIRVEIKEGKQQAGEDLISKRVIGIDNTKDKYRVLVVDDKKENLRVVVDFLHWAGFETSEASGGEEAIAKFESWSPHLVLMDIRMPLMDGYEATRRIKATEKGKLTPFIALTASSFEVDWKNNSGFNFQGYIRKPFRESELLHSIAEALGTKYMYEELKKPVSSPGLPYNAVSIVADLAKLPKHLVHQMQLAVEIADFQRLNELIGKINIPKLKQHLVLQASNFNLDYFQQILSKKDTKNEN